MNRTRKILIMAFLGLLTMALYLHTPVMAGEISAQASSAVSKAASQKKDGLHKINGKYYYYENGKKLKNQWKDVIIKRSTGDLVRRYYFKSNGAAVTHWIRLDGYTYVFNTVGMLRKSSVNKLFTVGNYQYCPDKYGRCQTGWLIVGGKLYFANSLGRIVKDRTVSGVTFKGSQMVNNTVGQLKLRQMQVVRSLTNDSMSKRDKPYACWTWLTSKSNFSYIVRDLDLNDPLWPKISALNMLNTHMGDCISFSCAFAAMASELGYKPTLIYGRVPGSVDGAADGFTTHCWVLINGQFYDPEGQFAGWNQGVFGLSSYPFAYQVTRYVDFATGKTL